MAAPTFGPLHVFSTAYDPSDLPGSSVDPLGFERGYVALADVCLPGLTTVTDTPRYLSMLAAGLLLASDGAHGDQRPSVAEHSLLEHVMRFERLWALASVLAWRQANTESSAVGVVRGVSYARYQADRMQREGLSEIRPDFRFLRQQRVTGGVGIYRGLLEGAGVLFKDTWRLTPDLGEPLGRTFLEGTATPASIQRAVASNEPVSKAVLLRWGAAAQPLAEMPTEERDHIRDGFMTDLNRRCSTILALPHMTEPEPKVMTAVLRSLRRKAYVPGVPREIHMAIGAALNIALRYERVYRLALLGFERILWIVRRQAGGISTATVSKDPVVGLVRKEATTAAPRLVAAVAREPGLPTTARTAASDAVQLAQELSDRALHPAEFVQALLLRHKAVQEGKFDRGHRKSPWVVEDGKYLRLAFARPGGLDFEATALSEIENHDYRFKNAARFARALRIRA